MPEFSLLAALIDSRAGIIYKNFAGAICPTIANRQENTIDTQYQQAIQNVTRVALRALALLRSRHPDAIIE